MIHAIAPASCGELIQGWLLGGEKLISYGIDCYSHVYLREGNLKNSEGQRNRGDLDLLGNRRTTKAYKMLKKVLQYYGVQEEVAKKLHLEILSEIPVGKGMASSTADLSATALAIATYLGKTITQREIASLCVEIEPTDSTVFSEITLFDHLKGNYIKSYGNLPSCNVLLLEGKGRVNTLAFRRINRGDLLIRQQEHLKNALRSFEMGIANQDLRKIGEAAIYSSLANQPILFKAGLEDMMELALKIGAYGINVAHSGTVVGIIYDGRNFDQERFIHEIKNRPYYQNYPITKDFAIVKGGAKIL